MKIKVEGTEKVNEVEAESIQQGCVKVKSLVDSKKVIEADPDNKRILVKEVVTG